MVTGEFTLQIKPLNATNTDYQLRKVGATVSEDEYPFPEGTSTRHKSLILNYQAATNVYLFAIFDGLISEEDGANRIEQLRQNLKRYLPAKLWSLIEVKDNG